MKNNQKGFVPPLIIVIIVLLTIGGGAYIYVNKRPITTDTNQGVTNSTSSIDQNSNKTSLDISKSANDIVIPKESITSPDKASNAWYTEDGKIFIYKPLIKELITIDVLHGSTTIPGFSTPNYAKKQGDWYASRAYYYSFLDFIGNDKIMYKKDLAEYVIKSLLTGLEETVNGDVLSAFQDKYLIYTKYSNSSASPDNDYILYDLNTKKEIVFFPKARDNRGILSDFTFSCDNKLYFIHLNKNWPTSEEVNADIYKYDILESRLDLIKKGDEFKFGAFIHGISDDNNRLYVTLYGDDKLVTIDLSSSVTNVLSNLEEVKEFIGSGNYWKKYSCE